MNYFASTGKNRICIGTALAAFLLYFYHLPMIIYQVFICTISEKNSIPVAFFNKYTSKFLNGFFDNSLAASAAHPNFEVHCLGIIKTGRVQISYFHKSIFPFLLIPLFHLFLYTKINLLNLEIKKSMSSWLGQENHLYYYIPELVERHLCVLQHYKDRVFDRPLQLRRINR